MVYDSLLHLPLLHLPIPICSISELQHVSILICTTYCNITPVFSNSYHISHLLTVIPDYTFLDPSLSHSPDEACSPVCPWPRQWPTILPTTTTQTAAKCSIQPIIITSTLPNQNVAHHQPFVPVTLNFLDRLPLLDTHSLQSTRLSRQHLIKQTCITFLQISSLILLRMSSSS